MPHTERPSSSGFAFEAAGCAYLAEASRLLSDSLEYEATLATVAGLALPHLGGWCIVDVVEDDGRMRRLAVVHPDPALQVMARRLAAGWPPRQGDRIGAPLAVSTRRSEIVSGVTEEMVRSFAHDPETLRLLRHLGIGSLIVAPMLARGHVHGAMTFVSPHDHHYGRGDLELAEDLARRAAMAIDNARLYRAAARSASAAERASHAKSEFLATMSHEMRTPLNAVLGYVDLLELELPGPVTDEQRAHLGRIRSASGHLLAMVDQVLDLARLEGGKMPIARERAAIAELVDAAVERSLAAAAQEQVSVVRSVPACRDRWFIGDPTRVEQAIDHLLSNAVKFTAPGGTVRVTCGVTAQAPPEAHLAGAGPWVCVEVEDTGVGIAPERITEMFEPFRQADGGHTRTEGGAGLGLTLARHLARLTGGDVTARSAPGVGSCFTLWLPAAPPEAPDTDRDAQARRRAGEVIEAAGRELMCHVDEVVEAYVRRLRADASMEHTRHGTEVDLMNHAATLVTDVAQSMGVLGGHADDAPQLLRDGSRIQRLVSELHGEQRFRLGWGEPELRRDFDILRDGVESCIRAHADRGESTDAAAAVAARLLRQSERISVQAFRAAAAHAG